MKLPFPCTRTFAKNGQQAIEKVQELAKEGFVFHLILMDIDMPVLNGLEASK
jgi:CheY-like chemotaxis protein